MFVQYKLASAEVSYNSKQSDSPVIMPDKYLDSLFNKKLERLAQCDYDIEDLFSDFDKKYKEIIACNSRN